MLLVKFHESKIVDIETGNAFVRKNGEIEMYVPASGRDAYNVCKSEPDSFWRWLNVAAMKFEEEKQ